MHYIINIFPLSFSYIVILIKRKMKSNKYEIDKDKLIKTISAYIKRNNLDFNDDLFSGSKSARQEDSVWATLCKSTIGIYDFDTSWRIQSFWNRNTHNIRSAVKLELGKNCCFWPLNISDLYFNFATSYIGPLL